MSPSIVKNASRSAAVPEIRRFAPYVDHMILDRKLSPASGLVNNGLYIRQTDPILPIVGNQQNLLPIGDFQ